MELIYSPHRIYAQGPDGACIAEITFISLFTRSEERRE